MQAADARTKVKPGAVNAPAVKAPAVKAPAATSANAKLMTAGPVVEGVSEFKLANGMQVLLVPDDSKPSVTINLTYLVGSRHENYGETGMAHLLEHMLFKGTPKFPMAWAEFTKRGMRANGTTWTDRTNYFASFSSSTESIDWYMRWLADSMTNSNIAKSDLDSEMTVVRNEMESGENNSFRVIIEGMLGTAYQWHNYGKSTIGARADVENVDIGRLKAFYKTYYQPDNAVLIVSGKFDNAQVTKLIADHYSTIPKPNRVLPKLPTIDPVQDGERSVTVRRPAGAPLVLAGFHMPANSHPDMAAIDVLEEILGDAPAGRLHKALVDTKLAASAFGFGFKFREPSFSFFGAQLPPTADVNAVRTALIAALDGVKTSPITSEELERARTKKLKNWELAFTDPEQVGVELSEAIASGDWRLFFLRRDQVKAVKLEDVQRVANERLLTDNRTMGLFIPTEKPVRAPKPELHDITASVKDYKGGVAMAAGEAFVTTAANIDARTERVQLLPGVKLALLPKKTRGAVVTAQLRMGLGSLESLKGQAVVGSAAMNLLDRGTASLKRTQISDEFNKLKAEVGFGGTADSLGISITTTRESFPKALALAMDVIRNASFPDDQVQEYKTQAITALKESEKEPNSIARNALSRHLNPHAKDDVRYAGTFAEQIAAIEALNAADLRAFHKRFLGAADVTVSVVGDFDAAALKTQLTPVFTGWSSGETVTRVPSPGVAPKAGELKFQTPDKQNAYLGMRSPIAVDEGSAEHAALVVADQIYSAGQNSRLWTRIREKEGISYGVGSSLNVSAWERSGMWSLGAIYAPQNLSKIRAALNEELTRALKDGFTAAEVKDAIAAILRDRELNRAQDASVAASWQSRLRRNKTFAESTQYEALIQAVTVESVNTAFRKHIKPENLVYAVAGDFAKAGQ
jgi:zinc protease